MCGWLRRSSVFVPCVCVCGSVCVCVPPQEQRFPEFVRGFLKDMYPKGDVPQWVQDAMVVAEISLDGVVTKQQTT